MFLQLDRKTNHGHSTVFFCALQLNKAVQVLHGSHFAWQKQEIIFPMGKMSFLMQNIFIVLAMQHGLHSCHAKPLYGRNNKETVKIVKILTYCYSTRKTIKLSSFTFLLVNSAVRYSGVI